jgi:hypothetical protein
MAAKKTTPNVPPEQLDIYKKLIAELPDVELKGAAVPYTSYNGHMFSYFENDGSFGLRLPKQELESFLEKYQTTLFVSYGVIKKEFALVPETLLLDIDAIRPYFGISFEYVKSLKAK